jgi:hypothetical protein
MVAFLTVTAQRIAPASPGPSLNTRRFSPISSVFRRDTRIGCKFSELLALPVTISLQVWTRKIA